MSGHGLNIGSLNLKSVSNTTFQKIADTIANWGHRKVSIAKTKAMLTQNTKNTLKSATGNEVRSSKQKEASAYSIPKSVVDFIQHATSKDKLRALQKKLDDPQSVFNKLTHAQKGTVNRLIIDKIVVLSDSNKVTTRQTLKPSPVSSNVPKQVAGFINNATTKDQLIKLQTKLKDPQSQLSKLSRTQKRDIDRLIIDKMLAISDGSIAKHPQEPQKVFSRSSTAPKQIAEFINNSTTKDQLIKLQKKLKDPQSQLSKLPITQKRDIDRLIIDKMLAISDAQALKKH